MFKLNPIQIMRVKYQNSLLPIFIVCCGSVSFKVKFIGTKWTVARDTGKMASRIIHRSKSRHNCIKFAKKKIRLKILFLQINKLPFIQNGITNN